MLPLSEIDALQRTVDEQWCSPVADAVAAAWALPPGAARWWRSSASHVFATSLGYLRFAPESCRSAADTRRVAGLVAAIAALGLPVAAPVACASGELAAAVPTRLGVMNAALLRRAPGAPIDSEELTPVLAGRWGATLARLHATPPPVPLAGAELVSDPALAHLPRDTGQFGLTHGDFELDNIAWEGGEPTIYDFDDAGLSWFAADIAFALRDLTGGTGRPTPEHHASYEAFLAGYREVRAFDDETLLPLFSRRLAALAARRAAAALDSPEPASLRMRLEGFIARQLEIAEQGV
ncbi:hypothetical protein Rhe02_77520 [Rhizocola hellebori]|uniref:Aminoglycoside phosphotransferase domain-containing protein n=1 Tax=Rhizocola hellebori TaxID=1392758 RepID=A0A8J3VKF7_9ACTN|nr:phosphotransferase [Rhizocola hellebori]GIH09685.1 hypothetical protein Rhe02_77520 [Rhizocola hellebori]